MDKHYLLVIDVWSNPTFVGPFAQETEAYQYAEGLNPQFSKLVMNEQEYTDNVAAFGPAPLEEPR